MLLALGTMFVFAGTFRLFASLAIADSDERRKAVYWLVTGAVAALTTQI